MSDSMIPTTAESWASPRKVGLVVQLPSGNVARVKRTLSLMAALEQGTIPNLLAAHIRKAMESGTPAIDFATMDMDEQAKTIEFINTQVAAAVVEPPVLLVPEGQNIQTWQPPAGHISIEDILWEDKLYIFQVAQGGPASLEQFRSQQARLMESLSAGNGVGGKTKQPSGSERSRSRRG